jgi:hypothetical protein
MSNTMRIFVLLQRSSNNTLTNIMQVITQKFTCGKVSGIAIHFNETRLLLSESKMPDEQKIHLGEIGLFEEEALSLLLGTWKSLEEYAMKYAMKYAEFLKAGDEDTSKYE